jgi:hypothetical protein
MNRIFIYTFLTNTAVTIFFKALLSACFSLVSFLGGFLFNPENEGNLFLKNAS